MLPEFVGGLIIFQVLSVSTGNTVRKDTIYLAVKEGMACSLDFYFQTIHMAKSKKWALKKKKKKRNFYREQLLIQRFLSSSSSPGYFYRGLFYKRFLFWKNSGNCILPQGASSRNSYTQQSSRNIFQSAIRQPGIDYMAVSVGHFVHSKCKCRDNSDRHF